MPRRKPFSAKQKKKQLQEKRERKRHPGHRFEDGDTIDTSDKETSDDERLASELVKLNQQPKKQQSEPRKYDPNRYKLHFEKESKAELAERKKQALEPLESLPELVLEVSLEDIYQPGSVLDMPKRPEWKYTESKQQLDTKEESYFQNYLDEIYQNYSGRQLSYFEHNLETWRQLWRVLEMSDVVLLITDIRHPVLHFPPALYDHVVDRLGKHLVLVLNKIDLAPPSLVAAWRHYFQDLFPRLHLVCFTSFPREDPESDQRDDPGQVLSKRRKRGHFSAVGPTQLLKACQSICQGKVELGSWEERIEAQVQGDSEPVPEPECSVDPTPASADFAEHVQFRDGILTIGCIGHPNVGKSSLMNGLVGRKVVSASRTPGHTKHFQTIFLTPAVRLVDSPGLVFPSLVNKQLQILSGIYPTSQVQEPYTAVGYLAQRIPLIQILKLQHPDQDKSTKGTGGVGGRGGGEASTQQWSSWDICDAWAEKRGFVTAKASRTDVYRAANNLLRLAVEGRLCLCFRPPGYTAHKVEWEADPFSQQLVSQMQSKRRRQLQPPPTDDDLYSDLSRDFSSSEGHSDDADDESGSQSSPDDPVTSNPYHLLDQE